MSSDSEDFNEEPPSSINPYEVLGLETTATAAEVKTAYRKQALKHHPDKAQTESKDEAHKKFQEIAFAYAILSDERRRKRYDTTGRTEETLDLEDDDFNWSDFYREQWADVVTGESLEKFKKEYKNSDEEARDLLASYEEHEGDMNAIFENVMLSNPIEDEDRFRNIIDKAIEDGKVRAYKSYTHETKASRKRRLGEAKKEEAEALELAKELGVDDKLFGGGKPKRKSGKKGKEADEEALALIIQQRQKSRSDDFLANLEAKYAGKDRTGKKRAKDEEPPEEMFEQNARRPKKSKAEAKPETSKSAANGSRRSGRLRK
ncbi:DnaJ domain-containing protein [Xylona heveae TC161]|uniref:DnaJ domain-containing protein n=1 Tax=Xylona heveae (strain CBS 132557 / TC161) TaxID=1328760 RepID=A0A165IGU8_XYLHT|nr:DnaJ domain-containing protein [Xylona heveae TC161]KZF24876.1 DnaJ domain-containing protein [Xylona heveae TC161]